MFQFDLFGEWRNRRLYGQSLADALRAEKTLQRPDIPDRGGNGRLTHQGEVITIAKVLGYKNTDGVTRGSSRIITALIEDANGKVHDVDAAQSKIDLKPAE
jgi:hypothetical protein